MNKIVKLCIILLVLFLLVGCMEEDYEVKKRFNYNNEVIVINGFFKGQSGIVKNERHLGFGNYSYEVEMATEIGTEYIEAKYLSLKSQKLPAEQDDSSPYIIKEESND